MQILYGNKLSESYDYAYIVPGIRSMGIYYHPLSTLMALYGIVLFFACVVCSVSCSFHPPKTLTYEHK